MRRKTRSSDIREILNCDKGAMVAIKMILAIRLLGQFRVVIAKGGEDDEEKGE